MQIIDNNFKQMVRNAKPISFEILNPEGKRTMKVKIDNFLVDEKDKPEVEVIWSEELKQWEIPVPKKAKTIAKLKTKVPKKGK